MSLFAALPGEQHAKGHSTCYLCRKKCKPLDPTATLTSAAAAVAVRFYVAVCSSARRSTPRATQHLLPLSYLCDFDPQLLDGGNIKYKHRWV
jgi:hypothetical protein